MSEITQKTSFPLKKLETLIKLAVKHNLELLALGDIKIIPRPQPKPMVPSGDMVNQEIKRRIEAAKATGKELTHREIEDQLLFGDIQ